MAVLLAGVRVLVAAAASLLCAAGVLVTAPVLAPATGPVGPGGGPPLAVTGFDPYDDQQTPQRLPDGSDSDAATGTPDPEATDSDIVSGLADSGIPTVAMRAYRAAAKSLARTDPTCGLDWALLAAIGRVESNHGRYGGAALRADGTVTTPIYGPALLRIGDSDGGRLDGDASHERAVGPMQFLPGTWAAYGADGSGDGRADPQNIDDAALAAGRYLCADGSDLVHHPSAAVYRYNHSTEYVALVLSLAQSYRSGNTPQLQAAGNVSPSGAGGPSARHGDQPGTHERPGRHGPTDSGTKTTDGPGSGPSGSTEKTGSTGPGHQQQNSDPPKGPTKDPSKSPSDGGHTPSDGSSQSDTPTPTHSASPIPSATDSSSPSPSGSTSTSATPTQSASPTPSQCPSPTPSKSAKKTPKPTPTGSKSPTPTPTCTDQKPDKKAHHS